MTPEDLNQRIAEMKTVAAALFEPDKTLQQIQIRNLQNQIDGMALAELAAHLEQIALPDLAKIDEMIKEAQDAQKAQEDRVNALNSVFSIVSKAVGLVL